MTITQNWEFPHRFFEWFSRFCERKSEWAICSRKRANCSHRSFVMSDLSKSLTVALLKKAMGAKRSHSLFCSEGPERFAHSHSLKNCSFVQSYRSDSLFGIIRGKNCKKHLLSESLVFERFAQVALLSWATWVNRSLPLFNLRDFELMSKERLSKRGNSQPCHIPIYQMGIRMCEIFSIVSITFSEYWKCISVMCLFEISLTSKSILI